MASARYTTDELVALLKHSALANVVVEGGDDVEVFRNLERKLKPTIADIDFIDAGDRNGVLAVWKRHEEVQPSRVCYVADSDLWIFSSERDNYPGVVFTNGYSIENCCIQADTIVSLTAAQPRTKVFWDNAIESLSRWFCAELWHHEQGLDFQITRGINGLLDFENDLKLTTQSEQRIAQN